MYKRVPFSELNGWDSGIMAGSLRNKNLAMNQYHRRISILDNFLDTPGHVLLRVLQKIAQRRVYMRSTNTLFSKNNAIMRFLKSRGKLLLRGQRE
uniref:Uncharacterized protein n=1 Tax=Trichogramma kaykai TaxID=54128 RepID=A0ABD2WWK6_9HYME